MMLASACHNLNLWAPDLQVNTNNGTLPSPVPTAAASAASYPINNRNSDSSQMTDNIF